MNLNPSLSMVGIWTPIDPKDLNKNNTGFLLQNLSGLLPLDKPGLYGVILAGNAAGGGGFSNDPSFFASVRIGIIAPNGSGGYKVSTEQFISDPIINGTQSIVVADFNKDGVADIFLSAENEMPFILKPSVAYLSNGSQVYNKITLSDSVINHSAILVYIDGNPTVVATAYPIDNTVEGRGTTNAIYTFENGQFKIQPTKYINGVASGTLGRYGGKGELYMVRGDVVSGWDGKKWTAMDIVVYPFDGKDVVVDKPVQIITPYLSTLPEFKTFPAQVGGAGLTHTYQVWSIDMNHDGNLDILAAQTMWSTSNKNYPTALQTLINTGNGAFIDKTALLNKSLNLMIEQFDYNPTFLDIDGSGIQTLFFGSLDLNRTRQANHLLLNDGTGALHIGLHDEFLALADMAFNYLRNEFQGQGYVFDSNIFFPKFIAVPQVTGEVNYIALVNGGRWYDSGKTIWQDQNFLVYMPIGYKPGTDYIKNVEILDRNSSKNMRTWAGNDIFSDANANKAPARIDGGLGLDISTYSGKTQAYTIKQNNDFSYSVTGNQISDTLMNIERLKFSDGFVAIDLGQTARAGQALLLIGAVLGRDIMMTKRPLMGTVIDLFDQGYTMQQLAGALMRLPIWGGTLTASNSSTDIANYLLTRVNGRAPSSTELASAAASLDGDPQGTFLAMLAQTAANVAQVDLVGLSKMGFDYPLPG